MKAGSSEKRAVGNDDQVQFLAEFAAGATGHIEASRVATGSKMDMTYELTGTEGAIQFDGERMNEIRFYSQPRSRRPRGLSHDLFRPGPSALWQFRAGCRPWSGLQRSQGDRGRAADGAGGSRPSRRARSRRRGPDRPGPGCGAGLGRIRPLGEGRLSRHARYNGWPSLKRD